MRFEDQVVGQPVVGVIAPEHRAAFAAMHQRVIAGESMQLEFEVQGLKGGRRRLETHAVPMQEVNLEVTRVCRVAQRAGARPNQVYCRRSDVPGRQGHVRCQSLRAGPGVVFGGGLIHCPWMDSCDAGSELSVRRLLDPVGDCVNRLLFHANETMMMQRLARVARCTGSAIEQNGLFDW